MSDEWERNGQLSVNVNDVTRYALQRIGELDKSHAWTVADLVRQVVAEVLHQLNQDGCCSFDFHQSEAEFRTPEGTCISCGRTEAEHVRILICDEELDDPNDGDG